MHTKQGFKVPSPAFRVHQFSDLERGALRPGNVRSAYAWRDVLEPAVARYCDRTLRRYFRSDAASASSEVCEFLEAGDFSYAIRVPANKVLQGSIADLLKRPVGRPPKDVRRYHAGFIYQAATWDKPGGGGVELPKSRVPFRLSGDRLERSAPRFAERAGCSAFFAAIFAGIFRTALDKADPAPARLSFGRCSKGAGVLVSGPLPCSLTGAPLDRPDARSRHVRRRHAAPPTFQHRPGRFDAAIAAGPQWQIRQSRDRGGFGDSNEYRSGFGGPVPQEGSRPRRHPPGRHIE